MTLSERSIPDKNLIGWRRRQRGSLTVRLLEARSHSSKLTGHASILAGGPVAAAQSEDLGGSLDIRAAEVEALRAEELVGQREGAPLAPLI